MHYIRRADQRLHKQKPTVGSVDANLVHVDAIELARPRFGRFQ